jgi:hypothetical protein
MRISGRFVWLDAWHMHHKNNCFQLVSLQSGLQSVAVLKQQNVTISHKYLIETTKLLDNMCPVTLCDFNKII